MKILDIVNQLRLVLPKYTDLFSNTVNISNSVVTSGSATFTTSADHDLLTGDAITIVDSTTQTPIVSASQDGLVFTFTTGIDHDLTENWHETIALSGFSDTDWNDSFTLLNSPNRRTFTVRSTNTLPVISGGEFLNENRVDGINGYHEVTKIDNTTFSIEGDFLAANYIPGYFYTFTRIDGTVNFERALEQYTEFSANEYYIFVVPRDSEVSKDRSIYSDAVSTPTNGTDIRLRLIGGFNVFIFADASEDMMALQNIDTISHDLLRPILKTLHGARFDSGLTDDTSFRSILTGHGQAFYDKTTYVHVFNFEVVADIIEDDAVEIGDTRAYRDTNYTQVIGTQDMTTIIDHDDDPLDR